jgi:hypothetical protein
MRPPNEGERMIPFQSDETSGLQKAIDHILKEMSSVSTDSEKYAQMADQLVKLYNLKEVDSKRKISRDTLAIVAGNIFGIMWIARYEREHVITSKALQFLKTLIK